MQSSHNSEKPFTCTKCDKKFAVKGNLNRHLNVCQVTYSCDKCSYASENKKHLANHVLVHDSEKIFLVFRVTIPL